MGCGTIAALALMGGGAGASMAAGAKERSAMNAATQAELQRQQGFAQHGQNLFQQSLGQSGTPVANQQVQQGNQQVMEATQNAARVPFGNSVAPLPGAGNSLASAALDASLGRSQNANAALQGYSNYGFQQGLKDQSIGSQLGVLNNQARSSASVLPYEVQQASTSQSGLNSLGQLMSIAGMLTGLYGLTSAPTASASSLASPGAFDASATGTGAWGSGGFGVSGPGLSLDTTWFPGFTQ